MRNSVLQPFKFVQRERHQSFGVSSKPGIPQSPLPKSAKAAAFSRKPPLPIGSFPRIDIKYVSKCLQTLLRATTTTVTSPATTSCDFAYALHPLSSMNLLQACKLTSKVKQSIRILRLSNTIRRLNHKVSVERSCNKQL